MAVSSSTPREVEDHLPVPTVLLDTLGDAVSREILVAGMARPVTAEEFAAACEVSESTIYRRLERLSELGLVERVNHLVSGADVKSSYRTVVDGLTIRLDGGGLSLATERQPDDPVVDALATVAEAVSVDRIDYDAVAGCVDARFCLSPEAAAAFGRFLSSRHPGR